MREWGIGRGRFLTDAPGFVMPDGSVVATEHPELREVTRKLVDKAWRAHFKAQAAAQAGQGNLL